MTHDEILRQGMKLVNEGRYAEAADMLAEDVRWYPRIAVVDAAVLTGREEVIAAWRAQADAFGGPERIRRDVVAIEDRGGGVLLVEATITAKGGTSGAEVRDDFAMLATIRGEQIVRIDTYDDRDAALRDIAGG